MEEKKRKKTPNIKSDPISIMIYMIICLILYFIIGILIKLIYYTLLIPCFNKFRDYTFDSNPLNFPFRITYTILYLTPVIQLMTILLTIILFFIMIIYVIWKILQMIPLLGPALIAIIPPFRQFEEAGIFAMIDNILNAIVKFLPKSIVKMFRAIFIDMVQFTKDKLTDIMLIINPNLELNESEFDKLMTDLKRKNEIETFEVYERFEEQVKEEKKKPVNVFILQSEKALEEKNLADKYKGLESLKPDMEMTERMYATFNNEVKKMRIKLDNTPHTIKLQLATLP